MRAAGRGGGGARFEELLGGVVAVAVVLDGFPGRGDAPLV